MTTAISAALQALIRGGNAAESLRRASELLIEVELREDPLELASLLATVSLAHQYVGRPQESLLALYRAIDLLGPLAGDNQARGTAAWLHSLMAADLAVLGDAAESLSLLNRAQTYLADAGADANLAVRILNNIAVTQHRFGRNDEAIESIKQAIEFSTLVEDPYYRLHSQANLVIYRFIVARDLAETAPAQAAEDAANVLALANRLQDEAMRLEFPHVVGMMYREAGPVLVETGNVELARQQLQHCHTLAVAAGRMREASALLIRRATVERLAGAPKTALALLTELGPVDDEADSELALEAHGELSETFTALHRFEESLSNFRIFHRLQLRRVADLADAKAQGLAARLGAEQARLRAALYESRAADLSTQVMHDPLTGVGNRRLLDRQLADMTSAADDFVTVLFADLDHFKSINDVYGHLVGDRVLIQVAALLSSAMRGRESLCRYGGEEFVLILPAVTTGHATLRAERLRRTIAEFDWASVHHGLHVTCSIGVATGRSAAIHEVMFAADSALALAKQSGRNRVSSSAGRVPPPRADDHASAVGTGEALPSS